MARRVPLAFLPKSLRESGISPSFPRSRCDRLCVVGRPPSLTLPRKGEGTLLSSPQHLCIRRVYFAVASTSADTSSSASMSHSRFPSSAARASPSTGSTRSLELRLQPRIIERHLARAQRFVGLPREGAARSRHRHPRRAQLRIEPVDLGRRADMELARERGEARVAAGLVVEMLKLDSAKTRRQSHQIGKAQLRAGEIVPAGRGRVRRRCW